MSGLVAVKYNKLPTSFLYKEGLIVDPISSFLDLVLVAMGVFVDFIFFHYEPFQDIFSIYFY